MVAPALGKRRSCLRSRQRSSQSSNPRGSFTGKLCSAMRWLGGTSGSATISANSCGSEGLGSSALRQ